MRCNSSLAMACVRVSAIVLAGGVSACGAAASLAGAAHALTQANASDATTNKERTRGRVMAFFWQRFLKGKRNSKRLKISGKLILPFETVLIRCDGNRALLQVSERS